MASFTSRLWMPVMGGRARPLAAAVAGAGPGCMGGGGDWGRPGLLSDALPESAEVPVSDDWPPPPPPEPDWLWLLPVLAAMRFSLRFSRLRRFFFLRSFFSFFFSFLRRLAYSGSSPRPSAGGGPFCGPSSTPISSSESSSDLRSSRTTVSGAQPSRCSFAMSASRSSESFGGL